MRSRPVKIVAAALGLAALLGVGVLAHRRLVMGTASALGVEGGRLAPCPASPNCVSSFAEDPRQHVEPLAVEDDPDAAMARLKRALGRMPRTRIVDATDRYLHAEARSPVWGYVDDLEILIDASAGKIHLRSASRTGYSDLGVNRRRVRALVEHYRQLAAGS